MGYFSVNTSELRYLPSDKDAHPEIGFRFQAVSIRAKNLKELLIQVSELVMILSVKSYQHVN